MVLKNLQKAPFPWFGGKRQAAPVVWEALGDVGHYVEPFMGSLAVLLERPHPCNRSYYSETVNDADGFLVNAWRSIQLHPEVTAEAASWPVSECDLHARHIALVQWHDAKMHEMLMGRPDFCDPKMAGWWLWGQSSWIGSGWCSGTGPWTVDADSGRIVKQGGGVHRKRPHLGDNGNGVNRPQAREPGVHRKRPHLGDDGRGVNHAGCRENGVGVDFHPMTMPELLRWFQYLSARLRHVRILCGDWERAVTNGASKTLSVRQGKAPCGVFLDPPYGDVRCDGLYAVDDLGVAAKVQAWCLERGADPLTRIVLAGFDTEHTALESHGWRVVEWYAGGFLRGGMGVTSKKGTHQQKRERLWLSPHCLTGGAAATNEPAKQKRKQAKQAAMFNDEEAAE